MAKKPLPAIDDLHKLLRYDPKTGYLYWRERAASLFNTGAQTAERRCKMWNTRYAGTRAFTAEDGHGYHHGAIFDTSYKAHRVIFAMVYGVWPVGDIDHINHDRADNRIVNLRAVSRKENLKNASMRSDNTSGVVGVSWSKSRKKWVAYVSVDGKVKMLGRFMDICDAINARTTASAEFLYHKNHGKLKTTL